MSCLVRFGSVSNGRVALGYFRTYFMLSGSTFEDVWHFANDRK